MRTQSGYKSGGDTRAGRRETQSQGGREGEELSFKPGRKLQRTRKEGEKGSPQCPKAGVASGSTPG